MDCAVHTKRVVQVVSSTSWQSKTIICREIEKAREEGEWILGKGVEKGGSSLLEVSCSEYSEFSKARVEQKKWHNEFFILEFNLLVRLQFFI